MGIRHTLLLAVLPLLVACAPGGQPTGQVIARVNDTDISALQFDYSARRMGVTEPVGALRTEIVHKLVDRELAMQRALEEKLDRDPDVVLQLEEARRDVLARVYSERVAARAPRPGEDEAARYFSEHPALFAQRRIYRLREAALPADLAQLDEVRRRFAAGQPAPEVLGWLRTQQARFNEDTSIRAAEQLPIEALPRLAAASEGQTMLFESPRGVIVYQVLAAQAAPVSWDQARPVIVEHLARQAGKRAVEVELQHLRGAARIITVADAK